VFILTIIEGKFLEKGYSIVISPDSVNGKKKIPGGKLIFGKNSNNNIYNFPNEENVGNHQFEVSYKEDLLYKRLC